MKMEKEEQKEKTDPLDELFVNQQQSSKGVNIRTDLERKSFVPFGFKQPVINLEDAIEEIENSENKLYDALASISISLKKHKEILKLEKRKSYWEGFQKAQIEEADEYDKRYEKLEEMKKQFAKSNTV